MSDQRSAKRPYHVIICVFFFVQNSSLKFLTAKFLMQCYRVLLILYLPDSNKKQHYNSIRGIE